VRFRPQAYITLRPNGVERAVRLEIHEAKLLSYELQLSVYGAFKRRSVLDLDFTLVVAEAAPITVTPLSIQLGDEVRRLEVPRQIVVVVNERGILDENAIC
jgi:hypothetical protein